MQTEFPEFLMPVAEENWIRGYQQAFHRLRSFPRLEAAAAEDPEGSDPRATRSR